MPRRVVAAPELPCSMGGERGETRAHQIADEDGFPSPVAEDNGGRVWDRREVVAWARVWRRKKPWR